MERGSKALIPSYMEDPSVGKREKGRGKLSVSPEDKIEDI